MTPIRVADLPEGHAEKPYYAVEDSGYCDLCHWSEAFEDNNKIWLCNEHARELGHLW